MGEHRLQRVVEGLQPAHHRPRPDHHLRAARGRPPRDGRSRTPAVRPRSPAARAHGAAPGAPRPDARGSAVWRWTRCGCRSRSSRSRSAIRPNPSSRPWARMPTRSVRDSTSWSTWEDTSTVRPLSPSAAMASRSWRRVGGSTPRKGSSSSTSSDSSDQGQPQLQPLAHPPRPGSHPAAAVGGEPHQLQRLVRQLVGAGAGLAPGQKGHLQVAMPGEASRRNRRWRARDGCGCAPTPRRRDLLPAPGPCPRWG